MVSVLGLTGIPFVNVRNGCATGGVALATAANAIRAGETDLALVVGFDKHARGAFAARPADYGHADWYAETGLMITTQFFSMKDRRYLHTHGLKDRAARTGGGQSLPLRRTQPDGLAAHGAHRGGDPVGPGHQPAADAVHAVLPG